MAEEQDLTGQPQGSVPTEQERTDATAPAAASETPQKYGGKTAEEMLRELQEKDRYISELAEAKTRAEYEAQYHRNLLEFGAGKKEAEEPPSVGINDEEFVLNPAKAVSRIVEERLAKERAEREKRDRENYILNARSNYETGRSTAMRQNPKLFHGVEREVSDEVFKAFERNAVSADALRDPGFWEASASLVRFLKGERNLDKYFGPSQSPVAPTHTETPSPTMPPQAGVSLTPEQEEAARLGGFTREQFAKLLAEQKAETYRRSR